MNNAWLIIRLEALMSLLLKEDSGFLTAGPGSRGKHPPSPFPAKGGIPRETRECCTYHKVITAFGKG